MKRRVFVAIGIEEKLQKEIIAWQEKLPQLPVRLLQAKNLHVTLVPPWYCAEVNRIIDRLKSFKGIVNPFTIVFEKVSFGPDQKRPRLLWATGDTPKELKILQSKLIKTLGMKGESREFLLHLTIARFKTDKFSKFPIKSLYDKVFWQERINSFKLMESHLARSGAEYETIFEFSL